MKFCPCAGGAGYCIVSTAGGAWSSYYQAMAIQNGFHRLLYDAANIHFGKSHTYAALHWHCSRHRGNCFERIQQCINHNRRSLAISCILQDVVRCFLPRVRHIEHQRQAHLIGIQFWQGNSPRIQRFSAASLLSAIIRKPIALARGSSMNR